MHKEKLVIGFLFVLGAVFLATMTTGCARGFMLQAGYLPVSSIDHREVLSQKSSK